MPPWWANGPGGSMSVAAALDRHLEVLPTWAALNREEKAGRSAVGWSLGSVIARGYIAYIEVTDGPYPAGRVSVRHVEG